MRNTMRGFELLLMTPQQIMEEYHRAETTGELDEMLLKVCYAAQDAEVSDTEFRSMIQKLLDKKPFLLDESMPQVRFG